MMVTNASGKADNSVAPEPLRAEAGQTAQKALLERPSISIRTRIAAVFVLLFVLLSGVTIAAIVWFSEFKTKLQFLETVSNYTFEIQEGRRFEKNFFLYGTGLTDALANVHVAQSHLQRSAEEIQSVIGREAYLNTRKSLARYEDLLERLHQDSSAHDSMAAGDLHRYEVELRRHGAEILEDAQQMIDKERLSVYSMVHTARLAAFGSLVFMLFVMAYIASFIIRSVLTPLARFVSYTDRIAEGDFSPILPVRGYRDEFSNLALAINQMLSELVLRQEQLTQSGKMAAVGALTSGIAHELNNPLNNIAITTEALTDGYADYSDEERLKMLGQIYTQVERASGTVGNLLDFTRKEQPTVTSLAIGDTVRTAARLVGNELKLGEVELDLDVQKDLPEIKGNPRNLQQVFLNLFLNAIQAMPDGGRLSIRARSSGDGWVRVDVSDTGAGIPAEDLEKVFDPFFTTKEPGKGTGLGLSVAYSTIDKHQGKITVESVLGEGTTFSVFLPCSGDRSKQETREG